MAVAPGYICVAGGCETMIPSNPDSLDAFLWHIFELSKGVTCPTLPQLVWNGTVMGSDPRYWPIQQPSGERFRPFQVLPYPVHEEDSPITQVRLSARASVSKICCRKRKSSAERKEKGDALHCLRHIGQPN